MVLQLSRFSTVFDDVCDIHDVGNWVQSRVIPDTEAELIEYFLNTEAQEIEFEIARLRPRQVISFFPVFCLEICLFVIIFIFVLANSGFLFHCLNYLYMVKMLIQYC